MSRLFSRLTALAIAAVILTPAPASADVGDAASGFFSLLVGLGVMAVVIAAIVWFFRGPAQHADDYVNSLAARITNDADRALFLQLYQNKNPKNVVLTWFLNLFLSPTVAYLYLGRWGLAAIAFITIQGLGFWWFANIFLIPTQVMAHNTSLADHAMTDLQLARPGAAIAASVVPTVATNHAQPALGSDAAPAS